jgi:hypothetical protein
MKLNGKFAAALMLMGLFQQLTSIAFAQSTEERFQDVFITAGYATAFGAALGAASLSFYEHPEEHMKDVAVGASLGFIGGTLLGTYVVLTPVLAETDKNSTASHNPDRLALIPNLSKAGKIEGGLLSLNLQIP